MERRRCLYTLRAGRNFESITRENDYGRWEKDFRLADRKGMKRCMHGCRSGKRGTKWCPTRGEIRRKTEANTRPEGHEPNRRRSQPDKSVKQDEVPCLQGLRQYFGPAQERGVRTPNLAVLPMISGKSETRYSCRSGSWRGRRLRSSARDQGLCRQRQTGGGFPCDGPRSHRFLILGIKVSLGCSGTLRTISTN